MFSKFYIYVGTGSRKFQNVIFIDNHRRPIEVLTSRETSFQLSVVRHIACYVRNGPVFFVAISEQQTRLIILYIENFCSQLTGQIGLVSYLCVLGYVGKKSQETALTPKRSNRFMK